MGQVCGESCTEADGSSLTQRPESRTGDMRPSRPHRLARIHTQIFWFQNVRVLFTTARRCPLKPAGRSEPVIHFAFTPQGVAFQTAPTCPAPVFNILTCDKPVCCSRKQLHVH